MDPDSPWQDADHTEAEWTRITTEFTNSGYREGIIAGKEAALQSGFDDGFAHVGVPLGRELGRLRGTAAALRALLSAQRPDSLELEEIRSIYAALSAIQFSDIAPRDLEAEQHAKEHLGFAIADANEDGRRTEDVAKLRERLALVSAKLGLPAMS